MAKVKEITKNEKTSMSAPEKMQLLFTVVSREKTEFFVDILQGFEINLQMVLAASGTANDKVLSLLGLTDTEKSVIISAVRRDRAKDALATLDDKFNTVKGAKGIAFTVPMSSTIGVAIYQFLANKKLGGF